jgi:predicted patatin/cPLA2 family phospholipase
MPDDMITHIYFSGGGLKGLCYLGILRYMYMENMTSRIKHSAGTSMGAYFALILALQIPLEFLEEELVLIVDNFNILTPENYLYIDQNSFAQLLTENGMLSLDFVMKPAIKYMQLKYGVEDMTFIDFVKRTGVNLYINTVNINRCCNYIFNVDTDPNVSVIDAVKASMSVPYLFFPVEINGELYADGIRDFNDIFKDVDENLVFRVLLFPTSAEQAEIYPKNHNYCFMTYFMRMFEIMMTKVLAKDEELQHKNVLSIYELPYEKFFKFKITDDYIVIQLTREDFDNLILQGFICMTRYMGNI